jgi:hypothetical protein
MIPRYDERREVYRDCRFCRGKGCLACPGEADKAYRRAFPEGPKPIATIKIDEIGQLKDVLGPDAMRRYFGYEAEGGDAFERDLNAKLAEIRARDSGSDPKGEDATAAECGASQSGGSEASASPKESHP